MSALYAKERPKVEISISLVKPTLKSLKHGELPKLYNLDVEFSTIHMVKAKDYGLSYEWVKKIESMPNSKYELLRIANMVRNLLQAKVISRDQK